MAPIVQCMGLTKTYGGKLALNQIYLNLERGRIIGLLGPNGSGKTTLIKLIAGLLVPTSGDVYVMEEPIGPASKSIVSYLPDHSYLNGSMQVRDIIDLFADFYENFDTMRAYDMMAKLQINPKQRLKTLSKGTQEKVQLVLVMSRRASLYILDEPLAGVDPAARDYILDTILSNYDENASILISTHLISDIENILDEVLFIKDGTLHTQASVDELREQDNKSIDTIFREVFKC